MNKEIALLAYETFLDRYEDDQDIKIIVNIDGFYSEPNKE